MDATIADRLPSIIKDDLRPRGCNTKTRQAYSKCSAHMLEKLPALTTATQAMATNNCARASPNMQASTKGKHKMCSPALVVLGTTRPTHATSTLSLYVLSGARADRDNKTAAPALMEIGRRRSLGTQLRDMSWRLEALREIYRLVGGPWGHVCEPQIGLAHGSLQLGGSH